MLISQKYEFLILHQHDHTYLFSKVCIHLPLSYLLAGNTFLEGLLANGWLSKLVSTRGHVEKSIATWAFNLSKYIHLL